MIMEKNIFEELREKKDTLIAQTHKAKEFGWISGEREKEIIDKINNDVLTIGVIGQMKCGKSTFLNAFVFQDVVLPAATTPMTATLSVITYGEKKKLKAEFYTSDEWNEQKQQASRNLEDIKNSLEESKVKAAKELVSKSVKLGSSINSYLGQTKEDSLDNLIEYVGAEGKFVSITKSVTIYYPEEYLKGVEIVDTPGFNDPILSREERTKAFLNKADVVILMLYAGRPFDATDRDILFKNVRQCGIGKVLIGINKYDIPFANGEYEDEIKNYVVEEIKKACRDCEDDTLNDILNETTPIPLSAEMSLLSKLPMSTINANDIYQTAWKRHCDNFDISTQQDLAKLSHLDNLTFAVKNIVEKEKANILIAKPANALKAAGDKVKSEINKQCLECEELIKNLSYPEEELEEKKEMLSKASKRLCRKVDALREELDEEMRQVIRKGKSTLEDDVDSCVAQMNRIVDNASRWADPQKTIDQMNAQMQKLTTRTLKRSVQSIAKDAKGKMLNCTTEFFTDASDIIHKYIPDIDFRSFEKEMRNQIEFEINDADFFKFENTDEDEKGWLETIGGLLYSFVNGCTFGTFNFAMRGLTFSDNVHEWRRAINEISSSFDADPVLEKCLATKDIVLDSVKQKVIDEFVEPLQKQVEEILNNIADKAKRLDEAQISLNELKQQQQIINHQIVQFSSIEL